MQLVLLSARPAMLAGTLRHVRAHQPWIGDVLVVAPARLAGEIATPGVQVLTDEQLLGGSGGPRDHAARNYALRAALATSPVVEPVFLCSDDDSRPLVDLPETTFVRDGRYRRYVFGALDDWEARATSFDAALHATRGVLALHGLPRLAYSSHMPQVLDKALWAEAVALLAPAAARHGLDEWSAYFNTAGALHPDRFADPEPYVALGWPDDTSTWQALVDPGALLYENCYLESYGPDGPLAGLDPDDTSYATAVDKVVRWRAYELDVLAGRRLPVSADRGPGALGSGLRAARARTIGDPVLRERRQRAATAAVLRALRRPW